ncbi:MAG TPA: hypothetical protein VH008_12055 [Pseudonocardia sp.]|nr:hypothetical protein [Pseudonocardia sp.]
MTADGRARNGAFMQAFERCGLATRRDAVGAELVDLGIRHGFPNTEILGHLVRLQARCALGDLAGADRHADTLDQLAARYQRPLVDVFTRWYRALRLAREPRRVGRGGGSGLVTLGPVSAHLADLDRALRRA